MSIIKVKNVSKDYQLGKTTIKAVRDVSFDVGRGDFLSIVGPSGCGKTTLLNLIGCIDKPTAGSIIFQQTDVSSLKDAQEADIRLKKIGFIFQSFNLIPVLNIRENIEFPMVLDKKPVSYRKKRLDEIIEAVGLPEFEKHKPDELSGGQRQRVAIARALVNEPDVVIADEPTANLDSKTGNMILDIMKKLNTEKQVTFVFSTHNPEIMEFAKQIIKLKDGAISSIEKAG